MALSKSELKRKVKALNESARKAGIETDLFYQTTLERYLTTISMADRLSAKIEEEGLVVTKLIKDVETEVTNPLMSDYLKAVSAADKTVQTLQKIVTQAGMVTITDASVAKDEL